MFNIKTIVVNAAISTIFLTSLTFGIDSVTKDCVAGYLCRELSDINTKAKCNEVGGKWKNNKCYECYDGMINAEQR